MDNNIYKVRLKIMVDKAKIPTNTTFPNFGVVLIPPPNYYEGSSDGWSVLIQFCSAYDGDIILAYFKYIAWDVVPPFTKIGMPVTLVRGTTIATGEVIDIVSDPKLHNNLVAWNPNIPKFK